jgi:hypothetical protein
VNAFYDHHQDNIRFSYRCFDRILAGQFQNWVKNRLERWAPPIPEAPQDGATTSSSSTFEKQIKPDQVVAILKGREPARILIAIGNKKDHLWDLEIAQRWVRHVRPPLPLFPLLRE